jgi:hypothetical protein
LVTRSISNRLFLPGTPEVACLCSPSQVYRRSHWKTSSSCNESMPICYGMFERMPCGILPSAWKWMEDASNTYSNYKVIVW